MTEVVQHALAGFRVVHDQGVIGLDDLEPFHAGYSPSFDRYDPIVILSEE